MWSNRLFLALGALSVTAALQDLPISPVATATLLERQIAASSVQYTSCAISSGLATPQPLGAVCGLAGAPPIPGSLQLIRAYTDVNSTASYSACGENCLSTTGCTQMFFSLGSTCSLYSGQSLYSKVASSSLKYYDVACFECGSGLSGAPTGTKASSSATAKPTTSPPKTSTTAAKTSISALTSSAWTSVQTNPKSYNMALTTVFTPPPECTESFTQVASNYWENVIVPAPQKTLTSCYPSQFYSSAVGAAHSVALPPFNPLVCPSGWSSIPYNSTYVVCCPDNWGAFAPNLSNAQRPLSGAICTSIVISGMLVDVTSYDTLGSSKVVPLTAGSAGAVLLATGFDGIVGVAPSATTATKPAST